MKDFAGRTAFVTGGANGVGLGIVRNLLGEGCKVAIADIRQDAIERTLATLDNREVMGVQLNVMDRAGFAAAADKAVGLTRGYFGKAPKSKSMLPHPRIVKKLKLYFLLGLDPPKK